MPQVPCALSCGWAAQSQRTQGQDAYFFECQLCGRYVISGLTSTVLGSVGPDDAKLVPYLRAHTRQATEAGETAVLTEDNWRYLARGHMNTAVATKLRKVLEYVGRQSQFPGDQVEVNAGSMYPLFDAGSEEEVKFLVEHLAERVLLSPGSLDGYFVLTVDGWASLEPTPGGIAGRCFVAMSFDTALDDAYAHGIQPAIKDDCGFDPIRIDRVHHNEKICDRILGEIRLAQFMVADFTLHRAGVYFEAGFAMGLSRPVIWTCRKDELGKTHFDTRQYNHIEWETPKELRSKLADRIRATIPR